MRGSRIPRPHVGWRTRFSPRQTLAARMLLHWPRARLAEACGLEAEAIELYEREEADLAEDEKARIAAALWADGDGVIAIPASWGGEGVRLVRSADSALSDLTGIRS